MTSRRRALLEITAAYLLAAAGGVGVYRATPGDEWLRLLAADLVMTGGWTWAHWGARSP